VEGVDVFLQRCSNGEVFHAEVFQAEVFHAEVFHAEVWCHAA
jgi:hypothetical protein